MATSRSVCRRTTAPVVASALLLAGVAAPAEAATSAHATTSFIGGGTNVNIRVAPSVNDTITRVVNNGAAITIACQLPGSKLGFSTYADNRTWNLLTDGTFIHDAVTDTPANQGKVTLTGGGYVKYSSNIPRCGGNTPAPSTREDKAVSWAKSQVGISTTDLTEDHMWSGWCELFTEIAYGTRGKYLRAIDDYNAQKSAGRIHTDTNPPAGALVFYNLSAYGHVGISIGSGRVISTQGMDTPLPVREHGVTELTSYLGWAYAPSDWPGR